MKIAILSDTELDEFRRQLLQDLIDYFSIDKPIENRWIKTAEVRKILGCSVNTIHNYKNAGILPCNKIGGTYYYDKQKVINLLNSWTRNKRSSDINREKSQEEIITIAGYEVY